MSTSSNIKIIKQINEYKEKLVAKGMYDDNFEILSLGGFIAKRILLHEQDVSYVRNNKIEHVPHE
ncbi:15841_t:CDS:1, partial [Dentiscutata erythropus]